MPLEKPTKPDAITAVPTPVPLRTDRANFAARGDAMMGWFPTGIAGVNTTLTYFGNAVNFVEQEANEAEASATAAAASNAAAAVNAAAAAASAGATVWVTGTTYAAGNVRYSPTNFQTYRDTVGGVSNTDPASDTTGRWISAMLPSAEAVGLPAMPPTAVFNFASGVIDRRFVESRSTAGTRYNIFGNLETLAAGVAKPTYDPATNECKGYLAEPAATYLAMRSTEMDNASYWAPTNVTVTPSAAVGIDGEMSMFKVEATGAGAAQINRLVVATATKQYFTVRVKKGSGATDANEFVVYNASAGPNLMVFTVDYDTGVVTHTTGSGATAEPVGHDGIWEIRIPCETGITIGNAIYFYVCFSGGSQAGGEYAYVGFPDIADKPNLTHIPTEGSNVTTVGGGLVMDLSVHDEVVNPGGFTVVIAVDGTNLVGVTGNKMLVSGGVDVDNQIYIQAYNGDWLVDVFVGASRVILATLGAVAAGRTVIAASFKVGACLGLIKGGSVVSIGALASIPAIPELFVGVYAQFSAYQPGVPIELVATFPRACTANELIALTRNL